MDSVPWKSQGLRSLASEESPAVIGGPDAAPPTLDAHSQSAHVVGIYSREDTASPFRGAALGKPSRPAQHQPPYYRHVPTNLSHAGSLLTQTELKPQNLWIYHYSDGATPPPTHPMHLCNMCSRVWRSSAICRAKHVTAIQFSASGLLCVCFKDLSGSSWWCDSLPPRRHILSEPASL